MKDTSSSLLEGIINLLPSTSLRKSGGRLLLWDDDAGEVLGSLRMRAGVWQWSCPGTGWAGTAPSMKAAAMMVVTAVAN